MTETFIALSFGLRPDIILVCLAPVLRAHSAMCPWEETPIECSRHLTLASIT